MCGRFTLATEDSIILDRFQLTDIPKITPRYNIAPTQEVLAVINDNETNRAGEMQWGLIPSWAKDKNIGNKMINARAETLHEKKSFKKLLERRRCLIIGDSFFEWKKEGKIKKPFRIQLKNGEPFAFAGLWDRWERDKETIVSCTVITTEPNELMSKIHNRMPVILTREHEEAWLDRNNTDVTFLQGLLNPYSQDKMNYYEVSNVVNSPQNDLLDCIKPI